MSTYREVRKQTAEKLGTEDELPCSRCGAAAARSTLAVFGSLCGSCYRQWCSEPKRPKPLPAGAVIPEGPHSWAYRLRARADAGQQLSRAQLDALRDFERRQGQLMTPNADAGIAKFETAEAANRHGAGAETPNAPVTGAGTASG